MAARDLVDQLTMEYYALRGNQSPLSPRGPIMVQSDAAALEQLREARLQIIGLRNQIRTIQNVDSIIANVCKNIGIDPLTGELRGED